MGLVGSSTLQNNNRKLWCYLYAECLFHILITHSQKKLFLNCNQEYNLHVYCDFAYYVFNLDAHQMHSDSAGPLCSSLEFDCACLTPQVIPTEITFDCFKHSFFFVKASSYSHL